MKENFIKFIYRVMSGQEKGPLAWIVIPILALFSFLFSIIVLCRSIIYDMGGVFIFRSPRKVISVGNLTMGGTGKTPFVVFLVNLMRAKGWGVSVITRGYMVDGEARSDEVDMLKELLPMAHVYASADRVASMKKADEDHLIEVFVLDDGFQHWKVERDLDIVILDAVNPFGNGYMIPLGILREPKRALARADIVVLTRSIEGRENIAQLRQVCCHLNPAVAVLEADYIPVSINDVFDRSRLLDMGLIADDVSMLCAVGNPDGFRATLIKSGARIKHEAVFMDHHVYTRDDILRVVQEARTAGIHKILTTHKDAVKLITHRSLFVDMQVIVVNIEVRIIHGENQLLSRIDNLLRA